MTDPKNLQIKDFTYNLPEERIAKHPLAERDESRLLIFENDEISRDIYRNIADHIPENSLLIFNKTKVVEARLLFQKPSGGVIEIFCLEPADQYPDITTAMLEKEIVFWKCLVGGASKWKHGMKLEKKLFQGSEEFILQAEISERLSDCFVIKMTWQPGHLSFAEILHIAGQIPLPPYINRQVEEEDKERYQTIYAQNEGSVAAPTAGLHFTSKIFADLYAKHIKTDFVTLHVGAGTFKPVKADIIAEHAMHSEFIDVSIETIESISRNLNKIIAVGTTSLRSIESLYWMGNKIARNQQIPIDNLSVEQWEPYELKETLEPAEALNFLIEWMKQHKLERLVTKTGIMIAPGYKLKIAKAIITNFHQPQSTLLLLIAAIVGDQWKRIYSYALDNDFRFLSYGDGCLLWGDGH